MELSTLDTKSPQEEGAFCHLRHTKFGHLLWSGPSADPEGRTDLDDDGEPIADDVEAIGVVVKGIEAPSVKAAATKIEKALKPVPRGQKQKTITIDEEEAGLRFAEALVTEFRGLTLNGEPVEATKENIRNFFMMSDNLVEQILTFARTQPNFFGKPSSE